MLERDSWMRSTLKDMSFRSHVERSIRNPLIGHQTTSRLVDPGSPLCDVRDDRNVRSTDTRRHQSQSYRFGDVPQQQAKALAPVPVIDHQFVHDPKWNLRGDILIHIEHHRVMHAVTARIT